MTNTLVTQLTQLMVNPNYEIPQHIEDELADYYGVLRSWDHITEQYTEPQIEWLWFICENYA
jgi:hypothetical protein